MADQPTNFARSPFWRAIAVAAVFLLALDVGVRLFGSPFPAGVPDFLPSAMARSGGVTFSPTDGIITTNETGTVIYRWGRVEGATGGMTVVRYDAKNRAIDRIDLK